MHASSLPRTPPEIKREREREREREQHPPITPHDDSQVAAAAKTVTAPWLWASVATASQFVSIVGEFIFYFRMGTYGQLV